MYVCIRGLERACCGLWSGALSRPLESCRDREIPHLSHKFAYKGHYICTADIADLQCWRVAGFPARSSWLAPSRWPASSGGHSSARSHPASLWARPKASSSLAGPTRTASIPRVPRALTPPPVFWQLNFLSCIRLLDCASLDTCQIIRRIVRRKEVSPPSVGDHVSMAEHRLHQSHVVIRSHESSTWAGSHCLLST
jgi:hypothetical protein